VIRSLEEGDTYVVKEMLSGFNPNEIFYRITCTSGSGEIAWGYVEQIKAQPLDEHNSDAQISDAEDISAPFDDPSQNSK
jgi:hypothetical protein